MKDQNEVNGEYSWLNKGLSFHLIDSPYQQFEHGKGVKR